MVYTRSSSLYKYVDYYLLVLSFVKNLLKNRATALRVLAYK